EDALDRGEARGPGDEQDGAIAVAQREAAEGPLDLQEVADLHRLEDSGGESSARHQANMEFDGPATVVRGAGEGEGAPGAILQHDIDVLAREEVPALARR